jgi:serine/threonine protein kinase
MTDERSNQAKSIFLATIDEQAPEHWAAFLEQACGGDGRLRADVERLLRAHEAIGPFHEAAGSPLPATEDEPARERPSVVIGPYKLLEQIGEGGFGIVFLADQQGAIRREVALKLLKPGMDTRQVLARFESERQALALMNHPNIARVLDAGATDSGLPYFVMELVRGASITEFCDNNRLATEARLKLFIDVCHAIQHAHQKGIIHRDIKPSNVLVALQDGVPMVKVIDFGVAKALIQKLTERTMFTATGQMIGTPAYMSPEQAESSGLDIDTSSDVYALGVLLYELLTGTTPLETKRLSQLGQAEIQRLIREEEAPRPSSRLSSLGGSATVVADNRRLEVKRLAKLLSADLDWIVMKALEKDRNRRYTTPGHFAEDIERYLRREAIHARPPALAYKVKKFTQRHRAAVWAGAAILGALLVGVGVATWQAVVATLAQQSALAAAASERQAKELAQARAAETEKVLEFLERQVLAAARPLGQAGGLGHDVTLRQAVEAALPVVATSFKDQPLIEARLRMTLGQSFYYLGEAQIAADQWEKARALRSQHLGPDHPDTLRSMNCLACSYADLGRRGEALELREQALVLMRAKLGASHPDTLRSMYQLANSYTVLGRHADALAIREETLALQRAKLGPDHPDVLRSMNGLAVSYANLSRHDDALNLYQETVALQKTKLGYHHPDTIQTMYNLAITYAALGRHADALALREGTLLLHKAKLGPDHPRTLSAMWALADSLIELNRGTEAVPLIDECVRRATGNPVAMRLVPRVMDLRLRHFEKALDADGCRQTVAMWEGLKRTDSDSLYVAARMWAVTAAVIRIADTSQRSDTAAEADRAMTCLKQAVAAGQCDVAHIKKDKDLDILRNREDFKRLLVTLEALPPGNRPAPEARGGPRPIAPVGPRRWARGSDKMCAERAPVSSGP